MVNPESQAMHTGQTFGSLAAKCNGSCVLSTNIGIDSMSLLLAHVTLSCAILKILGSLTPTHFPVLTLGTPPLDTLFVDLHMLRPKKPTKGQKNRPHQAR